MKAMIAGAGPIGLATAMLLARDGWAVTVMDKDANGPPAEPLEAWESWERPGVAQFRLPHFMMPRFRHLLDAEFPQLIGALERFGARRVNLTEALPRTLADRSPKLGDERFQTLTARRPVLEAAFASVAQDTPGVEIIRGVGVEGPVAGASVHRGIPHVVGVRTTRGEELSADLVIDAMGRRSKLPEWVAGLGGGKVEEEASDAGFAYYSRHFGARDGRVPEHRGPIATVIGTFHALTILGDNDTWTVALAPMAGDAPLKVLRHREPWDRVARSIPHVAPWAAGEPLTDVIVMAGVLDRYRRVAPGGRPLVTGLLPVGDAWACTNPTAGRGVSLGLLQAIALRDVLREFGDDTHETGVRFDAVTEEKVTPWYRDQVLRDRNRAAAIQAAVEGRAPDSNPDPARQMQAAMLAGANADPEVARASLDVLACLALPSEVIARPGLAEKVRSFIGAEVPQLPGPTRAELLSLLN